MKMASETTKHSFRKNGALTKQGEHALAQKLGLESHFTEKELYRIIAIYKKYTDDKYFMEKPIFMEMLHHSLGLTEEFFMNRVYNTTDANKDGRIDVEEFIRMLSVMLRGSLEEKSLFCFSCYDLNENNQLSRDEITTLLNQSVMESSEDAPDAVLDLIEMILQKLDKDGDGVLSCDEFLMAANEDWILGEAFGQCLPDFKHRSSFLALLEKKYKYS